MHICMHTPSGAHAYVHTLFAGNANARGAPASFRGRASRPLSAPGGPPAPIPAALLFCIVGPPGLSNLFYDLRGRAHVAPTREPPMRGNFVSLVPGADFAAFLT